MAWRKEYWGSLNADEIFLALLQAFLLAVLWRKGVFKMSVASRKFSFAISPIF